MIAHNKGLRTTKKLFVPVFVTFLFQDENMAAFEFHVKEEVFTISELHRKCCYRNNIPVYDFCIMTYNYSTLMVLQRIIALLTNLNTWTLYQTLFSPQYDFFSHFSVLLTRRLNEGIIVRCSSIKTSPPPLGLDTVFQF